MSETKELAQFVTEITYNDVPDEVIEKANCLVYTSSGTSCFNHIALFCFPQRLTRLY